jgi:hypothetical protein
MEQMDGVDAEALRRSALRRVAAGGHVGGWLKERQRFLESATLGVFDLPSRPSPLGRLWEFFLLYGIGVTLGWLVGGSRIVWHGRTRQVVGTGRRGLRIIEVELEGRT